MTKLSHKIKFDEKIFGLWTTAQMKGHQILPRTTFLDSKHLKREISGRNSTHQIIYSTTYICDNNRRLFFTLG